eukprot:TRINITY_DN2905_c0_g4_i1.p1 TRINITY_DN2905_c0_g4~~TRINITY_DN2905_c0_g4_i1.p1  ORF type:complete len:998 (-),score=174.41 TRINITY_DN2905_c0_g4_i1:625-3303(-)
MQDYANNGKKNGQYDNGRDNDEEYEDDEEDDGREEYEEDDDDGDDDDDDNRGDQSAYNRDPRAAMKDGGGYVLHGNESLPPVHPPSNHHSTRLRTQKRQASHTPQRSKSTPPRNATGSFSHLNASHRVYSPKDPTMASSASISSPVHPHALTAVDASRDAHHSSVFSPPVRSGRPFDSFAAAHQNERDDSMGDVLTYLMSFQSPSERQRKPTKKTAPHSPPITRMSTPNASFPSHGLSNQNANQNANQNTNQNTNQLLYASLEPITTASLSDTDELVDDEMPRENRSQQSMVRRATAMNQSRSSTPASLWRPSTSPQRDGFLPSYQKYTISSIRSASPVRAGSSLSNRPFASQWSSMQAIRRHADGFDLDPIISLLRSKKVPTQKQALVIFTTLSLSVETIELMIEKELVATLLRLLSSQDTEIWNNACTTLANMMIHEIARNQIAEGNGICHISKLLDREDNMLRSRVLSGYYKLTDIEKYASMICTNEFCTVLMKLIKSKHGDMRQLATQLLSGLCQHDVTHRNLLHAGLMKEVCISLKIRDNQSRINCLNSLTDLFELGTSTAVDLAIEADVPAVIVSLLQSHGKDPKEEAYFLQLIRVLQGFSNAGNTVSYFIESGVFDILVDTVRSRSLEVQIMGTATLAALADQAILCEALAKDPKVVVSLIHLSYSSSKSMKQSVARIFRRMSEGDCAHLLHRLDAPTAMIMMTKSVESSIQIDLIYTLFRIVSFDWLTSEERTLELQRLIRLGLVDALTHLIDVELSKPRLVLARIIGRIVEYVQDFDRNTTAVLGILCKLFSTPDREILQHVVHASFVITSTGFYTRTINDSGLPTHLKKYCNAAHIGAAHCEEGQRALEILNHDSLEINPLKDRDRAQAQAQLSRLMRDLPS